MTRHLIVGGGLAGLRTAEALRARGYDGELVVVGAETEPPYNRPPLTKELLAGKLAPADVVLPEDVDATWVLGTPAAGLDPDSRIVVLDDGSTVAYDGLVIASGLSAVELPGQRSLRGVYGIRTLADALGFRKAAALARRIVIVGGGVLGSEAAATLAGGGAEIVIVDREPHLVAPLGPDVGECLARWHEQAGVRLVLGADISGFEGDTAISGVRLADGTVLPADVVLVAVGGRPNVDWLSGSGVVHDPRRGVCTDAWLRVAGRPEIVAVGDVVDFDGGHIGRVRLEHWSHAVESAQVAAASLMEGGGSSETAYRPVPTMWSDQFGRRIQAAGFLHLASRVERAFEDADKGQWLLECFDESDALVAAIGVDAGRHMLRRQIRLRESLWRSSDRGKAPEGQTLAPVDVVAASFPDDSRKPQRGRVPAPE
jgi:NADPH-dependent 2,4-dienoyl-CoA reductase/sulfur reductase-like enzyme